jgi:AcrR family transcriptional regulator
LKLESLREKKKKDKMQRIKAAARELFGKQGFDATTTRQIADKAHVGLATLFLYATDKRDLLFLVFNDDLDETMRVAFKNAPQGQPLIDRLLFVFRRSFRFFGKNQLLSQDLLRELTFYTTGMHSARFLEHRARSIERIKGMVDDAKETGEVSTRHASATVALCIFYLQAAELRHWLGGDAPSLEKGIRKLKELLNVLMTGISVP